MSSLDSLLYRLLRDDPVLAAFTVRGGGVQPSDLVRRVGRPLARVRLGSVGLPDLDPRTPLSPADAETVAAVVHGLRTDLLAAAGLAHATVEAVVDRGRSEGLAVRRGDVGEIVLTRVAARMTSDDGLYEDEWCDTVCRAALARLAGSERLTAGEFAGRLGSVWDAEWEARGAAALSSDPPSGAGLGRDRRPPLVRPRKRVGCTWLDGTDRSVYDRYALHWRGRSSSPEPAVPRPGHVVPTRLPTDLAAARTEVARAALPYGLARPEHRRQLRGVFAGAGVGAAAQAGAWHEFRSICRSDHTPGEIAVAVEDCLALALDEPALRSLTDRLGDLGTHVELVSRAVSRKVWIDLHRREREYLEPACSCALSRYVRVAASKGIPEALDTWSAFGADRPDDAEAVADPDSALPADSWDLRANATFSLLLLHRDVAKAAFGGAPGWAEDYCALVAAQDGGPSRLLDVAELAAYLAGRGPLGPAGVEEA